MAERNDQGTPERDGMMHKAATLEHQDVTDSDLEIGRASCRERV